MASIFVWLRYSSARHLTWQRNYNTQPRILGEAQAKLTHKIAEVGLCICPRTIPPQLSTLLSSIGQATIVCGSKAGASYKGTGHLPCIKAWSSLMVSCPL